jgi:hypothetical protein
MDSKELRGLYEAYNEVYAPQEIDEAVKGESGERRKDLAAERRSGIKPLSAKEGEGYASHKLSQMSYVKRKRMGEEVEGLEESGLSQDTIRSAAKERQKRVDTAYAKDTPQGDVEGNAGMKKLARTKGQLNINKSREVRMRANEEVEQIDELSVNKMNAYINKAEKDRGRLNKKWDQGTATSKERKKVFDREEGEARASKKIRQKTGKDSFRLNALDKLKSAITKEEVEIFDVVLEYLVAEGYADTNESALVIMANMSEEWRESIMELYKGKHGQSEKEYMDGRSQGGKMISGDSKESGASYSHRSFRGQGKPAKPGKRQPAQGKMDSGTRADIQYRKANLKNR